MILRFKLLSVFLLALTGLVMLSACGDNTNTSSATLTTASATTTSASAAAAVGTTMSSTTASATTASSTVAATSVAATTASSTVAATTVMVVTTPTSTTRVAATTSAVTTTVGSTTAAGTGSASSDVAAGKQVFSLNCSRCHAQDGTAAGQGPKLAGNREAGDANNVTRTVRNGARGMPAFTTSQVSDSDLTKIIAYLKTLQ